MGSKSDWKGTMDLHCSDTLKTSLELNMMLRVISAHRTPKRLT